MTALSKAFSLHVAGRSDGSLVVHVTTLLLGNLGLRQHHQESKRRVNALAKCAVEEDRALVHGKIALMMHAADITASGDDLVNAFDDHVNTRLPRVAEKARSSFLLTLNTVWHLQSNHRGSSLATRAGLTVDLSVMRLYHPSAPSWPVARVLECVYVVLARCLQDLFLRIFHSANIASLYLAFMVVLVTANGFLHRAEENWSVRLWLERLPTPRSRPVAVPASTVEEDRDEDEVTEDVPKVVSADRSFLIREN